MNARLLLADHHAMFRECIAERLRNEEGLQDITEVSDLVDLLPLSRELQPDVILLEVQMPGAPLSIVRDLGRFVPQARIIFVTNSVADGMIQENLRCGAWGYVLKSYPMRTLLEAVREVLAGRRYYVAEVQQRLSQVSSQQEISGDTALSRISPREMVVLRLLAEGRSVKEVAYELNVSYKTVDNQTSSLMRKLDIHSRADLVRYAIREQLATV